MFGSSITLEPPKWYDGDVCEVLKGVKMLLEIREEVDCYSVESGWTSACF